MTEPVTIDNCENEPIHIPGAIQPQGLLVAFRDASLAVTQVSANVGTFFEETPQTILGKPFGNFVDSDSFERVAHRFGIPTAEELRTSMPFRVVAKNGAKFDVNVHRSGGAFILELEPTVDERLTVGSFDPVLKRSAIRLQLARDVDTLARVAATEVRRLTGFDRVMVYRFDADWNGEVVAEDRREDLEPFLGQHYPASDIPAQARRLYTTNPLRMIADVNYKPAPLVPLNDPVTAEPLDLSGAVLRSVSPMHIEYMKNMGVTASMSISLVIDGVLAGLIACHHYSGPRIVSTAVRDTAEFIAYQLSWQLRVVEDAERAEKARATQAHEAEVVRSIAVASELLDGLDTHALLALTGATGAAVVLEEGIRRIGEAPPEAAIRELVDWLRGGASDDTYATNHLAKQFPNAATWTDKAGGLLALAIARDLGEFILWFRPAVERVVHWAGDPKKSVITLANGAPRLSPRGSFELWKEVVRGRSLPWQSWEIDAASRIGGAILGGVRRRQLQLRTLNQRLIDADRAKDDFIATVSHELRTPLNAITGWTGMLRRSSDKAHLDRAVEVIERNAQVQAQLIEDLLDVSRITSGKLTLDVSTLDLGAIISSVLDAMALAAEAKHIKLKRAVDPGVPSVRGDASRLRQIVSNLVTNAVKFTPKGGTVIIALRKVSSEVELAVIDTGQGIPGDFLPHVFDTFRQQDPAMNRRTQGLGLGLAIARKLVELHGGVIEAESEGVGKGATFRVRLPVTAVGPQSDPFTAKPPSPPRADLRGKTLLIIEDDPDSREMLRVLLEASSAIVTTAEDAPTALEILGSSTFDAIVSDIGLPGKNGLELMREYRAKTANNASRTPAIALTAFTRPSDRSATLNAGFQAHVPKPVDPDEIVATILAILRAT